MAKDVRLALAEARRHGVPMVLGATVEQLWNLGDASLEPAADFMEIVQLFERWSVTRIRPAPVGRRRRQPELTSSAISASVPRASSHQASSSIRNGCMITFAARSERPSRRILREPCGDRRRFQRSCLLASLDPQRREAVHQVVGVDQLPVERNPLHSVIVLGHGLDRGRAPAVAELAPAARGSRQ